MELLTKQAMDTITAGIQIMERPCEKYETMKINALMKFHVKQYELVDLGNLSLMGMNMGIMKMVSIVITPTCKDMPLVSADYMYIMGKRKAYIEVYGLPVNANDKHTALYAKMNEIEKEYSVLEDMPASESWYRDLISFSTYKCGKKADDEKLNELLCRILKVYFETAAEMEILSDEDRAAKISAIKEYTDGLIDKGGISTDVFKKSLGEDDTREFFDNTFFGTSVPYKKLNVKKLRDNLYLLDEGGEATGYLLIGEERAAMIDTMLGYRYSFDDIRKLTDKPVAVVNTHYHVDHIFGNVHFEKAYISSRDLPLAIEFENSEEVVEECTKRGVSFPEFETVDEGDVIDLGGKTLKVYYLPGHTPGGILLLCPEERILFTGDSVNHFLWMQLDNCLSLKDFIEPLERVQFLEKEADYILHGHARDFDDISLLSAMLEGVKEIVAGNTEDDKPYEWFGGTDRMHEFKVDPSKKFDMQCNFICYSEKNIK